MTVLIQRSTFILEYLPIHKSTWFIDVPLSLFHSKNSIPLGLQISQYGYSSSFEETICTSQKVLNLGRRQEYKGAIQANKVGDSNNLYLSTYIFPKAMTHILCLHVVLMAEDSLSCYASFFAHIFCCSWFRKLV